MSDKKSIVLLMTGAYPGDSLRGVTCSHFLYGGICRTSQALWNGGYENRGIGFGKAERCVHNNHGEDKAWRKYRRNTRRKCVVPVNFWSTSDGSNVKKTGERNEEEPGLR